MAAPDGHLNAAQQLELAQRLHAALEEAGILIELPQTSRGNVRAWVPMPTTEILGLLASRGAKVSLISERPPLSIVREPKTGAEL